MEHEFMIWKEIKESLCSKVTCSMTAAGAMHVCVELRVTDNQQK